MASAASVSAAKAAVRGGVLAPELRAAIESVRAACRLGKAVQGHLRGTDTLVKGDKSPVTVADFGIQALIVLSLRNKLGGKFRLVAEEDSDGIHGPLLERVVSEVNTAYPPPDEHHDAWRGADIVEAIASGNDDGDPSSSYWVLDPVDGTKGFLRGDQYAIGLAYLVDGVPRVGVLGCPNVPCPEAKDPSAGTVFSAVQGQGAMQHALDGSYEGEISTVVPSLQEELIMCESFEKAHSSHSTSAAITKALGITTAPLRLDSMAKYCMLARGDASLYLRLSLNRAEKVWDHAAGVVIAKEAGATVTDVHGQLLDFTQGRTLARNKGVIVSAGYHTQVLGAARQVLGVDSSSRATGTIAGAGGAGAGAGAGAGVDAEASADMGTDADRNPVGTQSSL